MVTCFLRYFVAPGKEKEFEEYARTWVRLITKFGGTHLGYFMPTDAPGQSHRAHFSFSGLGSEGPANVAVAIDSFPSVAAYEDYRKRVAEDPECEAVTARFRETNCFTNYERSFVKPVLPG